MGYLSYFESGVGNHEVVEFSNFDLDFGKTQRGNECWYLVFPNLHFSNSLLPFDASSCFYSWLIGCIINPWTNGFGITGTESCCTIEIDRTSASIRNSGPTTFSRT